MWLEDEAVEEPLIDEVEELGEELDGEGSVGATVAEVVHGSGERPEKDSEAGRGRAGTGGGDQGGVVGAEVFMEVRVRAIEKSVHELRQVELQEATKKVL